MRICDGDDDDDDDEVLQILFSSYEFSREICLWCVS